MSQTTATACCVYGVVPSGTPQPGAGLGDPAAPVALLHEGEIAAVVSEIPAGGPIGTVQDLHSHTRVLDTLAASGTPVLPFRFGAVLTDERTVEEQLLAPAADRFSRALEDPDSWVQFTVRGDFAVQAVETSGHAGEVR